MVVVVCGARRGTSRGALPMLWRRRKDNVDEAVASLRAKGLEVQGQVCHVGNGAHRKQLVDATVKVGRRSCPAHLRLALLRSPRGASSPQHPWLIAPAWRRRRMGRSIFWCQTQP